jgi:hypothetical protein
MAHFAELDESNIVKQVIVVHNNELLADGIESEVKGIQFCQSLFGGNWVQTSYNGTIRKNFAGIGYTYDPIADHFFAPQPFLSWVLDENAQWQPPVPMPVKEGKVFVWDESTVSWINVDDVLTPDTIEVTQPDEADLTEGQN